MIFKGIGNIALLPVAMEDLPIGKHGFDKEVFASITGLGTK
jgi:hypothetical protein